MHCITANLVTVLLHHFATFHSVGTAVTAIVLTSFVVVAIIAVAVSKVLGRYTTSLGVDALTLQKEMY